MGDIPSATVAQSNAEYPIRSLTVNYVVGIREDLSASLTFKLRQAFESFQLLRMNPSKFLRGSVLVIATT
jgi:hypothetical protein